jgi:[CysO sulfur-carrier protein]-S-L-cysteine hydrolase
MQLLIPQTIEARLVDALANAGRREVGGILMGEHVGVDAFTVRDLTVQRKGGTFATFVRAVTYVLAPLRSFFDRTEHDYVKFNYLGEWHSHHSFVLSPSGRDDVTMRDMVTDSQLGAYFAVLMLVRLGAERRLESSVTVYVPGRQAFAGAVTYEAQPTGEVDPDCL